MRSFLLCFFFLITIPTFSQRPLTEKEKVWIDSLNTIYGKKNPWFDSLMKAEGKCMYVQSREHWMNNDTVRDVLHVFRKLDTWGVSDGSSKASFDYYPEKKKVIADYGPEIYLRPSGAVIVEFSYQIWGQGISGVFIRSHGDTLFNAWKHNPDTVLPGLDDPAKKIILAGASNSPPIFATIVIDHLLQSLVNSSHAKVTISECRLATLDYPTNVLRFIRPSLPFLVTLPDSVVARAHPGDTLFVELDQHVAHDTVRHVELRYFEAVRVFPFRPAQVERVITYSGLEMGRLVYRLSPEELHTYKRFVKRRPAKNDPQGIYYDPVYRWIVKEKRFKKRPSP